MGDHWPDESVALYGDLFVSSEITSERGHVQVVELQQQILEQDQELTNVRDKLTNVEQEVEKLREERGILVKNMSCLFKTAVLEISRKDELVKTTRGELLDARQRVAELERLLADKRSIMPTSAAQAILGRASTELSQRPAAASGSVEQGEYAKRGCSILGKRGAFNDEEVLSKCARRDSGVYAYGRKDDRQPVGQNCNFGGGEAKAQGGASCKQADRVDRSRPGSFCGLDRDGECVKDYVMSESRLDARKLSLNSKETDKVHPGSYCASDSRSRSDGHEARYKQLSRSDSHSFVPAQAPDSHSHLMHTSYSSPVHRDMDGCVHPVASNAQLPRPPVLPCPAGPPQVPVPPMDNTARSNLMRSEYAWNGCQGAQPPAKSAFVHRKYAGSVQVARNAPNQLRPR